MEEKKLVRVSKDRMICGVCTGIAKYLGVDVTVVRLIWALASLFTAGVGIIGYIAAAFIIPAEENWEQ